MKHYKVCMTIAGSDPSGGAGIQADIKTFTLLGCYAQAVPTSLTVQNTERVVRQVALDGQLVSEQLDTVMRDWRPDAVKIGITPHADTIAAIAGNLRKYRPGFIVLDPVVVSTSGHRLIDDQGIEALQEQLIPLCTLITPNIPEARLLAGLSDAVPPSDLAHRLYARYAPTAVLVKGGHATGAPEDILCSGNGLTTFCAERINTTNTHGTGCVLSSAIASYAARGFSLEQAVSKAKQFLTDALRKGADYSTGHGHGPLYLIGQIRNA